MEGRTCTRNANNDVSNKILLPLILHCLVSKRQITESEKFISRVTIISEYRKVRHVHCG